MIYGQQDLFFSSNFVGRIFFYSSAIIFFSITFVLHAILFFRQVLAGIFFFKITHPLPQELNGRPLTEFCPCKLLAYISCFKLQVCNLYVSCKPTNARFVHCNNKVFNI